MKVHISSIKLIFLCLGVFGFRGQAQTWTISNAPVINWQSIAISADGRKIVAAPFGGLIYTSPDGGLSWTATSAPSNLWNSVACSADGSRILAAANASPLLLSTNFGKTWYSSCAALPDWWSVACSGNGEELAALGCFWQNFIPWTSVYTSSDLGATWNVAADLSRDCDFLAASADGTTIAAKGFGIGSVAPLATSKNWGQAWQSAGDATWTSVALSADGTKILASSSAIWELGVPALLLASTNGGVTWAGHPPPGYFVPEITVNPAAYFLWIASSARGSFTAAAYGGGIYTSTDFGSTWVTNNAPNTNWQCIACSADGQKMVAAVWGGGIYTFQGGAEPSLSIKHCHDTLALSWTIPSKDFKLQESFSPEPGAWTSATVTPVPSFTTLQYQASVPKSRTTRFYRLISQ
jgi:photosystem II stability/assembly factor-like uncharacterized protein